MYATPPNKVNKVETQPDHDTWQGASNNTTCQLVPHLCYQKEGEPKARKCRNDTQTDLQLILEEVPLLSLEHLKHFHEKNVRHH